MSAPARLLSVRLQGFKSFAERTHVAFGPGISAVVGPNGSGKSNLADALRWALGEQGRALRTRKAEDVIWAGSERRPALGMADVQIVFDNADGLLPVEFGVVELGRRLFRSGENEYVLNRQRVRLRDLVDLLDSAHLAENAFLFIGQGMVDQALALRPEERRPLFEEVAGVRRHDRRRRRAEEQLIESEANLARVEDVAAELRPQVRRLAAQAQQQASRRDAGDELAEALLLAAHARWHAAAARLATAERMLAGGRSQLETAMSELAGRETVAGGLADRLSASAAAAAEARRELDAARDALTAARLDGARAESDAAAARQDLERLAAERAALEARLVTDRRAAAMSVQGTDPTLEHELRETEGALATATRELAEAMTSTAAGEQDREALRRATATRTADLDLARRRQAELQRELATEASRASSASLARDAAAVALAEAEQALIAIGDEEAVARLDEEGAAAGLSDATKLAEALTEGRADAAARLSAAQGHLAAVRDTIEAQERGSLGTAVRSAGGRGLADGLVVDDARRAAVAAALGELAAGYVIGRGAVPALGDQRGAVVVREAISMTAEAREPMTTFRASVEAAGGGVLADAITADPSSAVVALLSRAAWVPDLAAALELQPTLPAGWLVVTADGGAVVRGPAISLGRTDGLLERRAEAARLQAAVEQLEVAVAGHAEELARAQADLASASDTARRARDQRARLGERRRAAEADAAAVGRRAEAAAREAAWLEAQVARLTGAVERAGATLSDLEASSTEHPVASGDSDGTEPRAGFVAALESRVRDLRATRDRVEAAWHLAETGRRETERERARAEAAVAIDERRLAEIDAANVALGIRETASTGALEAARQALADATAVVAVATLAVDAVLAQDAEERRALGGAERAAASAREAVQRLQETARAVEREELEARLSLESLREQLLVELAGLGDLGLRHLAPGAPAADPELAEQTTDPAEAAAPDATGADESADVVRLEAALAAVAVRWAAEAPPAEAPSPGRLSALRRRFHELGAANPYALEEHAALAARLDSLESQRTDLIAAVDRTRALIAELDTLIASQFRATFGLLERAFDARFRQLFGGGFAKLSLTEPGDLATTGIEITARPPGKKPQALAMLSGGERALTAVALLFAMLEVRPVPFCVLDEVDAALDEANVGRFTDALRELGRTTQVVVITHNRGTIETADALYGVTVGDDSVSRVVSLRLEEATALARSAADAAPSRRAPIIPAGLRADELAPDVAQVSPGEAAG
ncbi:MAG: chromosome segregation protein SMC [Chloroflexi bacterium]|nr:chromosome segregation protein SMC [Chloroflexota bacterium]